MKTNHQEVDVVDMSGVEEEIRKNRMAAVELMAGTASAEELQAHRVAAAAMPSHKEIDYEM